MTDSAVSWSLDAPPAGALPAAAADAHVDRKSMDLWFAVRRRNSLAAIEHLLQQGADPNRAGLDGCSVLRRALISPMDVPDRVVDRRWTVDCVRLLLRYGADPNRLYKAGDGSMTSALHNAYVLDKELFFILLDGGGDVTVRRRAIDGRSSWSCLWAMRNNRADRDRELYQEYLAWQARARLRNSLNGTNSPALPNLLEHDLLDAAYRHDLDGVIVALERGASATAADDHGNTALLLLLRWRCVRPEEDFEQYVAQPVNAGNPHRKLFTRLPLAKQRPGEAMLRAVDALLAAGADPRAKAKNDPRVPLYRAATCGQWPTLLRLLDTAARDDLNTPGPLGRCVLHELLLNERTPASVIEACIRAGADLDLRCYKQNGTPSFSPRWLLRKKPEYAALLPLLTPSSSGNRVSP